MAAYWGIVAHSAYDMFSWYKYLSVILVFFPPLGFLSGNFLLIATFPDHCLLVPFYFSGYIFKHILGSMTSCMAEVAFNGDNVPT